MPLNHSLIDADDSVDVLYGVLCALMLALPETVRDTFEGSNKQRQTRQRTKDQHPQGPLTLGGAHDAPPVYPEEGG